MSSKKYRVIGKGTGRLKQGEKLLVVKHNYVPNVTTYYQETTDQDGVRHQWYMLDEEIQAATIEGHTASQFALDQGYTARFRHLDLITPFIGVEASYLFNFLQSLAFKSSEGTIGEVELSISDVEQIMGCSRNKAIKVIKTLISFNLIQKLSQKIHTGNGTSHNSKNLYKIPRYLKDITWEEWFTLKRQDEQDWQYPRYHKEELLFERLDKYVCTNQFNFTIAQDLLWKEGFEEFIDWFQLKYRKLMESNDPKVSMGSRYKLDQIQKYIANQQQKCSSKNELGKKDGSSYVELGSEKRSSKNELGNPRGSSKNELIYLNKALLKESINKSQSVIKSEAINKAISKDQNLTDRLTDIIFVYETVRDEAGYSDALFIATLQKAIKAKIKVPFSQYLLQSMINNMSEQRGSNPLDKHVHTELPEWVARQLSLDEIATTSDEVDEEKKKEVNDLLRQLGEIN